LTYIKYRYAKDNCGDIRCTTCGKHTDLIILAESQTEADSTMQNIGGHCVICLPIDSVIMKD